MYGIRVPGSVLAERIAYTAHMKTIYSSQRPYGSTVILANYDDLKGLTLNMIEPSGANYQYYGCASGRGKQLVRNEIEKGNFKDLTVAEALPKVAKILLKAQDEMKEKK